VVTSFGLDFSYDSKHNVVCYFNLQFGENVEKGEVVEKMTLELCEYGYPQIDFMGKNQHGSWVRITQGWFFPGLDENEPACYIDYYINDKGKVIVVLDGAYFYFDFETPLNNYAVGFREKERR